MPIMMEIINCTLEVLGRFIVYSKVLMIITV